LFLQRNQIGTLADFFIAHDVSNGYSVGLSGPKFSLTPVMQPICAQVSISVSNKTVSVCTPSNCTYGTFQLSASDKYSGQGILQVYELTSWDYGTTEQSSVEFYNFNYYDSVVDVTSILNVGISSNTTLILTQNWPSSRFSNTMIQVENNCAINGNFTLLNTTLAFSITNLSSNSPVLTISNTFSASNSTIAVIVNASSITTKKIISLISFSGLSISQVNYEASIQNSTCFNISANFEVLENQIFMELDPQNVCNNKELDPVIVGSVSGAIGLVILASVAGYVFKKYQPKKAPHIAMPLSEVANPLQRAMKD